MLAEETREHFKEREPCDESWGGTVGRRQATGDGRGWGAVRWVVSQKAKQRLNSARNNFECRGEAVSFESQ